MSATIPVVTLSLVISAFLASSSAAPKKAVSGHLQCAYSDHYLRITDGVSKWEKFVGNWDNKIAKIECGEKNAAALIGSYFLFFSNGKIKDKYIGSFNETSRIIALKGDIAAAVDGGYFITARAGGDILDQFIDGSTQAPIIAISDNFAAAIMGSNFVVSDGFKTEEKFVGSGKGGKLVVAPTLAGALMGETFVAYVSGAIIEKHIGIRAPEDSLVGGPSLIAASMGKYFVVLDGRRREIKSKFVDATGVVSVDRAIAKHVTASGDVTEYDSVSGKFSD